MGLAAVLQLLDFDFKGQLVLFEARVGFEYDSGLGGFSAGA